MNHVEFVTSNVCAKRISFDIDENGLIRNVSFTGGCPGNLLAISKLVEGRPATEVASILEGNKCGPRQTSCADQFAQAIFNAVK